MKTKFYLTLSIVILNAMVLNAQSNYTIVRSTERGVPSFIKVPENTDISHINFFELLKSEFQFEKYDELRLIETKSDKYNFTHYKYRQYYKNIPVFGGSYIIHEKNNFVVSANGQFIPKINVDTHALISKEEAIKSALRITGIRKYKTDESKSQDSSLSKTKSNQYANPTLVIAPFHGDCKKSEFVLCWNFVLADEESPKIWNVFIDAKDGALIHKYNLMYDQDVVGSTITKYNGTKNIVVNFNPNSGNYRLYQCETNGPTKKQIIQVKAYLGDCYSNTAYFSSDAEAGSIYWGIEQTFDFYFNNFNRNSLDDSGMAIIGNAHDQMMPNNAYWDGQTANFGSGDTSYAALVSIDIVGHEYSHGVTQFSSGLVYFSEPGALNESFSDIMGEAIEQYALGNNDWLMGNNIKLHPPYFIRSFVNPNAGNQPDTYYGSLWDDFDEEVHTNSGVGNYWFYLLTHGGSGTNDNGDNYNIAGIGWTDALKIAYRSYNFYFTDYTFYYDAVDASIQSASDLFGANSIQTLTVKDAWCAVGLTTIPCYMSVSSDNITQQENLLDIVPNPSKGFFTLNTNFEIKELEVYDLTGFKILDLRDLQRNQIGFDLSSYSSGMYLIQCTDKENNHFFKKLIIQ